VDGQGRLTAAASVAIAFPAGGTVTSVALTMPGEFSVSGSPVTAAGTLAATWVSQPANRVHAGPASGAAAVPAFRALVAADLPPVPAQSLTGTAVNVYLGPNQSAGTAATWYVVHLDTVTQDALGEYNAATWTFTPLSTGTYLVDFRATIGAGGTRAIASIWQGTTTEIKRISDSSAIAVGGLCLVNLTAGTGYTFQINPVTPVGASILGGAFYTSLTIRRFY
jgi:hypothetical protein